MATQYKTRIREAVEASRTIGIRAAARKYERYGITESLIRYWVKNGEVAVAKPAAFPGDTVLLDEESLRKRISTYTPHRDNAGRRRRSRTIPEMLAQANGQQTNGVASVPSNGNTAARPAAPTPPAGRKTDDVVLLNTQEYVEKFFAAQTRLIGKSVKGGPKELRYKTKHNYDWAFSRFAPKFPTVPLELGDGNPRARRAILEWMDILKNVRTGEPLDEQSKLNLIKTLTLFFGWLSREFGYNVPDLKKSGIQKKRGKLAVPMFYDDIHTVLNKGCRDNPEHTVILVLAQTNARLGELCTIRPELMGDHWVHVWGKVTSANETGHRPLMLPDESFEALQRHFKIYGQLVWVDAYGRAKPLAGPIEAAGPWPIDMRDHETYMVRPAPGRVDSMGSNIHRMICDAGVYQPGKSAHSFRRSFQSEYILNGGEKVFMRLLMGHFEVGDMDDLYTHARIADMVEQARKYAPRRFLQKEMDLGNLNALHELHEQLDDDDLDGDE